MNRCSSSVSHCCYTCLCRSHTVGTQIVSEQGQPISLPRITIGLNRCDGGISRPPTILFVQAELQVYVC
jgi:hypothetical protein